MVAGAQADYGDTVALKPQRPLYGYQPSLWPQSHIELAIEQRLRTRCNVPPPSPTYLTQMIMMIIRSRRVLLLRA